MTSFAGRCTVCGSDYDTPAGMGEHVSCRRVERMRRLSLRAALRLRIDRAEVVETGDRL